MSPVAQHDLGGHVGQNMGKYSTVGKVARDPVSVPQEPFIVQTLERCLCRVKLGEDCYIVTGLTGDEEIVCYGAPLTKWTEVCEKLLELAINSELVE